MSTVLFAKTNIIKIMKRKFAEKLKELRKEKHLSMKELSKEVGLSTTAICQWENCTTDISSDNLIILANYFGVTTDYLLGLED